MTQCIKPKLDIVWPPLFPQSPSVHFRVNKSNMMPTDQSQIQYNGENIPHLFQFDFPALFFFQVKLKSNVDFRMVYPCKFHAFFFSLLNSVRKGSGEKSEKKNKIKLRFSQRSNEWLWNISQSIASTRISFKHRLLVALHR